MKSRSFVDRSCVRLFKAEGIARGNAFVGGVHRDELVMALLRPEWAAHKKARAPL